ncbi:synaptogyrin-2-like [Oscarella lobularis]|uniref:synaptogyrin-2-like n=1 Tax=Oscarella lobularis TaxID=121494 RepID=UPI003313E238
MATATSYGGSTSKGNISAILTGQHFVDTIKKPQVITRLITLVCCIIVFGCIVGGGSASSTCYIDPDQKTGTCAFGVFVGVVGFILCLAYLIVDYLFELTNNIFVRKYTVLSDFAASTVWGLMFFVAFCVLAAKWTSAKAKANNALSGAITGNVQAAIAFAFFSTAGFIVLAVLAVLRFRQGPGELGGTSDEIASSSTTGRASESGGSAGAAPTLTKITPTGEDSETSGGPTVATVDVHAPGTEAL